MEAVLLIIVIAIIIAAYLVPPVLAMTVTYVLLRSSFEYARAYGLTTTCYELIVGTVGVVRIMSGPLTTAPYFELIPPLGVVAIVLRAWDRRRTLPPEPALPRACVI